MQVRCGWVMVVLSLIHPGCDLDQDGDGWTVQQGDCDDVDAAVNPGAQDVCDGLDNNCDGSIDNDVDGDNVLPCVLAGVGDDCDNADPTVYPGAAQVCDGIDHNCDGQIDCT